MNRKNCITQLPLDQRKQVVKQVRLWGDLNTDAILDSTCKIFSVPTIEGFIGYRIEGHCAVVFGHPVCSAEDQEKLLDAFRHHCDELKLPIIYAILSEKLAASHIVHHQRISIQFGHKLILRPNDDPLKKTGSKATLVRKKVKHALNEGTVIEEYTNHDATLEKEMEEIGNFWLNARHGPQVFIAHLHFFNDREGKRWFYAKHNDKIVGFLILNKVQASSGWLLNNLIISPKAPHGSSELLVTSTLKTLENEASNTVIVGPVTTTQIHHIDGLGTFSSWLVRIIFKAVVKIFRLDGQRVFWEKFQPELEPSYIIFDKINFKTLKALMRAMNVLSGEKASHQKEA